jgi:pyruvate dehydrogenase (quinone)
MKGDSDAGNMVVETAKQMPGAVLPGHHDEWPDG